MTTELAAIADSQGRLAQRDAVTEGVTDELTMVFIYDALRNLDALTPTLAIRTAVQAAIVEDDTLPGYNWATDGDALTEAGWKSMRKQLRAAANLLNVAMVEAESGPGREFERDEDGVLLNTSLTDPDKLREDLTIVLTALGAVVTWGNGFLIAVAGSELAPAA